MAAMRFPISYRAFFQLAVVVGLYSSCRLANAKSVRVGGDVGWTDVDPATGLVPDYAGWAASDSLFVNDILGEIA